ncbi:uncharacterized protein [Porites lutea]|uniref:uncharacterized protein isoform X3 n=1 Tax=Porites lutea TaxID=51062 RepID=UPI003CC5543D
MAASSDYPEVVKATRSTRSLDNSEACYGDTSVPVLHVTLLGGEWGSSAGGLSTINRELAIHLSNHSAVKISLLVPEGVCNTEEIREAHGYGITIVEAKQRAAYDRLDWLSIPPQDHYMDIVVGHGVKLGRQVQFIRDSAQFPNCKWVQVVHTAPEDLSRYKCYNDPISKGETKHESEVGLCKLADLIVPVGPRLKEAYSSYLQRCKTNQDLFSITPGLFQREFGDLVAKHYPNEDGEFKVLLFGRGDDEDFELKGYNIAAHAFTDQRLNKKPYHLIFVGAPEGKQEEVREKLLQRGIVEAQLTVRKFVQSRERLKDLLCEADLAIMPSKSEGFGLVALEALSAGLPILAGSKSGFAKALENVLHGNACIVNSDDPAEWAKAIEAVHLRHGMRLQEIKSLRASYGEMYCWKEQCEALVNRMQRLGHDASDIPKDVSVTEKQSVAKTHASTSGFSGEQCPVDEQPKTEDAARLSEESPSTCHTPSISGLTSDQGQCPDLQSLESLWNDYCSGVLNEAAERFLVTDDMKKKVNLVTLRLKTIIEEESYLTCKKALMEKSAISRNVSPSTESDKEAASPLTDTSPEDSEAIGRRALMNALRDGNTHKSFKRVSTPPEPPNKPVPTPLEPLNRPLLFLPERPRRPDRLPPSPRSQHEPRVSPTPMIGSKSRSPLPRSRIVSAPPGSPSTEKRSSDNPPDKPLPPASKKRPVPRRNISEPEQFRKGRNATVTVQLVLTRSIKVDVAASTQDVVRAAASTFKLSEDSFALWFMRNGQLAALQDKDLEGILNSPANNMETIYCYENKPQ